jgi:ADP-heptose:LPS heptosyltransferase
MKSILKKIEIMLRHGLVYPLMRLCLRNPIKNEKIDLQSVRRLLILRNDRIGDMVVSTPIFRKLKEKNPSLTLAVFASPGNAEIIRNNPFVDEIFIKYSNIWKLWKELQRCKAMRFDVVVNFIFNRTTSQGLMVNYIAPQAYKVGQGLSKYQMYFNRLLTLNRTEKHMVEILATIIDEIFGTTIESEPLSPEMFIHESARAKVDAFLNRNTLRRMGNAGTSGSYAVINFSAGDIIRQLSVEQVIQIVNAINGWRRDLPVIINPPGGHEKLRQILAGLDSKEVKAYPPLGSATLLEIASLIKGARYVVTSDTAIVHFASAVKIPVFLLFTPTVASLNHEWTPYGVINKCLYAIKGLGVDSIPSEEIVKELSIFESGQLLHTDATA